MALSLWGAASLSCERFLELGLKGPPAFQPFLPTGPYLHVRTSFLTTRSGCKGGSLAPGFSQDPAALAACASPVTPPHVRPQRPGDSSCAQQRGDPQKKVITKTTVLTNEVNSLQYYVYKNTAMNQYFSEKSVLSQGLRHDGLLGWVESYLRKQAAGVFT